MADEIPIQSLNDLQERMRQLESKNSLFNERLLIVSKNMIEEYKKLMKGVEGVHTDMNGLKDDVNQVKNVVRKVIKEMDIFAKKEDVKVLEKYINLWDPMKFMTEKDVLDLLKKKKEENGGTTHK